MSEGRRRRIVMLVQNGVLGDSRVQKQAEAAAAAGWEVTLLGRSRGKDEVTWKLGGATVRLLPVKRAHRDFQVRRGWLRAPLAYPPGPRRAQRDMQLRAWQAEIGEIKARQAVEAPAKGAAARAAARLSLLPRRVFVKAAKTWIRARIRQSDRLRDHRREMDTAFDRFANRFWTTVLGDRVWRRFDPALWAFEVAYGKVVDQLRPDLIHANDFQMLGVAARAKLRAAAAGRDVKLVWDAHEFLPGIRPWIDHPRWHPAQIAHENEYAPYADAVVTVSDMLARLLQDRHGLKETPTVVLNAPDVDLWQRHSGELPNLRRTCGLDDETPLMVYSGAPALQRGLGDMIEAMPALDGVHCAMVVSKPEGQFMRSLVERAAELGVDDRLHVVPYVEYWQVVPFLASADVGVIPLHHYQNHELALITKFFEYSHARLPIVVSDVETMGGMVRRTGQGEVCRAADPQDLARAVKVVLADPASYQAAYDGDLLEEWTWPVQYGHLDDLYRRLLYSGR